ncbi:MAG TPA: metallophosphoesterase [Burkholderiales bacterium]|nr:metallophosphoesterase [Burkholderiales bacterium]
MAKWGVSLLMLWLAGCAAQPPAPGEVRFALMGDTPYSQSEAERLDRLIRDLNADELAFVVHIGDITSGQGPCTDAWFQARKEQFARIRHPFVLLPGDNDWTDCHRSGHDPMERLQYWRRTFCPGKFPAGLERQRGEYCEHVRWQAGGVLFVALNVQGSNNNLGRNAAMDAEHAARMKAVLAWIDDSERRFRQGKLGRLVLLMQANPFLRPRSGANGFAALLDRVKRLAADNPRSVIVVNGDSHIHRDDEPLPGVRRIEPWGSPIMSWLHGSIEGGEIRVRASAPY